MRCVVRGCDVDSSCTSTSKGVKFFTFPTEPTLCEIWLQSLKMNGWKLTDNSVVCSKHFLKDDLYVSKDGQYSVRAGVIPVIHFQKPIKSNNWMTPWDVKVCRICFATECNLYPIVKNTKLDQAYETLTALANDNNLPPFLCMECIHRLMNCIRFRTRSIQANLILQEIIQKNDCLTLDAIKSCDKYQLLRSKLCVKHLATDHYDLEIKHEEKENTCSNEKGDTNDSLSLYDVNVIKVEKDETLFEENFGDHSHSTDPPRLHEVTLPGIKLEGDYGFRQDISNNEDTTNNFKEDSPMIHGTMGIKVKVETIEVPGQECIEYAASDTSHAKVPIGEDYPSDNIHLEELQKSRHKIQSHLKSRAGTNSHDSHSAKKLYICDVCDKAFSHKYNLIPHLRSHFGIKPFSCEVCKKGFSLNYNLVNHMRKHSGEKPFVCNICNKTFILRNVLQAHIRTHTGEKPYACTICDKVFSQRANLSVHSKIHTGEKPYTCDVCKKGFSQRCNLITHSRIHSGEKPYSCNLCPISFSRNYHLKSHLKIHSGEKPYTCDVCNKAFNSQSNLQKHTTIHLGEKPYTCNVCNKAFNRKGNLNTHIKIHSDVKPYLCLVCNKTFRRKDQLKIHIKTHSSDKQFNAHIRDVYDRII